MRKFLKYFILFLGIFCIFFYLSVGRPIYCDEVWVYGFSHNIFKGMTIYKDFNVLQMPLYFFLSSFFLSAFGDYIISMHILDCILIGFLFLIGYKKIGGKAFFVFFLLVSGYNGYNLLSLFLFMLVLFSIHDNEYNDFWVGILLGLIFITKQNIGFALFIPYLYYSRDKFKSVLSFFLPFSLLCIYFIFNSSFFEFFDCVFGSLFDFNVHNKLFVFVFFLLEIFVIFHLAILFFKYNSHDKRILYILFFQVMSYPIFDDGHVILSFIPYFYLLLTYSFKNYLFLIILLGYSFLFFPYPLSNIHLSHDIFFLRDDHNIDFSFFDDVFSKKEDYDRIFIADWYAYVYKLYYGIPIDQYDFLLSGNVGYQGVKRRVKEIDDLCRKESCLFLVRSNEFQQWKEFDEYVISNYEYVGKSNGFKFYRNG